MEKIVLSSWGLGGATPMKTGVNFHSGTFKNYEAPIFLDKQLKFYSAPNRLPPISRHVKDGIDFMPYILHKKVIIDDVALKSLINNTHQLSKYWKPAKTDLRIIEKLIEDEILEPINFIELIDNKEDRELLDNLLLKDLSASPIEIGKAISKSVDLWIKFYADFLNVPKNKLDKFYSLNNPEKLLNELTPEDSYNKTKVDAYMYSFECLSDINRNLLVSNKLDAPIYEWEDYKSFYELKLNLRTKLSNDESNSLSKMFNLFIPNFTILDINQLKDLRNDSRLSDVKLALKTTDVDKLDKEFVIATYRKLLESSKKVDKFSKYSQLITIPIEILTSVPLIGKGVEKLIEKNINKKTKWESYFVDASIKYNRNHITKEILQIEEYWR